MDDGLIRARSVDTFRIRDKVKFTPKRCTTCNSCSKQNGKCRFYNKCFGISDQENNLRNINDILRFKER